MPARALGPAAARTCREAATVAVAEVSPTIDDVLGGLTTPDDADIRKLARGTHLSAHVRPASMADIEAITADLRLSGLLADLHTRAVLPAQGAGGQQAAEALEQLMRELASDHPNRRTVLALLRAAWTGIEGTTTAVGFAEG
jgi:hypothetical protein